MTTNQQGYYQYFYTIKDKEEEEENRFIRIIY